MNTMGGYTLLRRISSNSDFSRLKNRPAEPGQQYQPTDVEHLANVISHGVWILPSVLALIFMVCVSVNGLQVTTTLVYGSALVLLFSTSTIFHILSYTGQFPLWRRTFHIGDRAVIYIFIASSYTPWLLLKEFHSWSEEFLCLVWGMALLGVSYAYLYHENLCIECLSNLDFFCLQKDLSGLVELSIGGAMYIFGVVFFKMDGVIPFAHAIWHCFVFVGSFCHFVAICSHLLGVNLPGF
uniref:Uncharacterized protein n=1 Tax=Biomphalaria glabrata TaxID=6526 RepID=A0A2C9M364_BIOGL